MLSVRNTLSILTLLVSGSCAMQLNGSEASPAPREEKRDSSQEWTSSPYFDAIKSYQKMKTSQSTITAYVNGQNLQDATNAFATLTEEHRAFKEIMGKLDAAKLEGFSRWIKGEYPTDKCDAEFSNLEKMVESLRKTLLNQLISQYDALKEQCDQVKIDSNGDLLGQKTSLTKLLSRSNDLVANFAKIPGEMANTYVGRLNLLNNALNAKIAEVEQAEQEAKKSFLQKVKEKLSQKRYLVSTLVGLTVVAGLAFGEHQNKMVSRFIFGQARAPEQIVSLAPLSWWSRTRGWFSGWFSKLSWFNRIRTQGVCVK